MKTYELGSSNYIPLSPNNNKLRTPNEYILKSDSKDRKISSLQSKIYDLKQRVKDYDSLNQRYKQLLNDFSILNEAKLRLEYEMRQRENDYNRRIADLKGQNESLQLGLNDKMTNSKKIFSENDILEREIGLKNGEINDLNGRLSDLSDQLDRTQENRNELSRMINNLSDNNINQNEKICKLKQDNICLTQICQDNEKNLKMGQNDINKLSQKIDENAFEMQNLNNKLVHHENNVKDLQHKLDSCNDMNIKLQNSIKNYEKDFDTLRSENDVLKNDLLNERNLRAEKENQNNKLNIILMDRERQLNQLSHDNDKMQMMNRNNNDKNKMYKVENDKLRNHVKILENQNENIINEIDNILNEDKKMREVLKRKNRIISLLRDNNDTLEKSINDLDEYINNSCNIYENDYKTNSPLNTYQFAQRSYI
jgi:chromosome segregation ATPase